MVKLAAELPDDIDALKALVHATAVAYETQVRDLRQLLSTGALEIESLKLQIAKLRRMQFGAESEKLDRQIDQRELRLEQLQTDEGEAAADAPAPGQGAKRASGRRALPERLPREDRAYEPECQTCPDCGGVLHLLGEDVSEQLEYVSGHWRVLGHRRPKKTCHRCDANHASRGSEPADRPRFTGSRPTCPCAGGQVLRSSTALFWLTMLSRADPSPDPHKAFTDVEIVTVRHVPCRRAIVQA